MKNNFIILFRGLNEFYFRVHLRLNKYGGYISKVNKKKKRMKKIKKKVIFFFLLIFLKKEEKYEEVIRKSILFYVVLAPTLTLLASLYVTNSIF